MAHGGDSIAVEDVLQMARFSHLIYSYEPEVIASCLVHVKAFVNY